jgi:hypothetical protein
LLRNSLRGGISTGSWQDLARTTSGALTSYDDSGFARSITALWAARHASFPAMVEPLIVARNDHHHGRGPRLEEEFRQANSAMDESLQQLMNSLEFLIDYPIRLVREMDAIRRSRRVVLKTLRLSGDHPGLPQEQLEYNEPLTRDDLYVELRSDYLHPLYPFIVSKNCQSCKSREIYFIERWDGPSRPATLKSFERGHIERSDEIGHDLDQW